MGWLQESGHDVDKLWADIDDVLIKVHTIKYISTVDTCLIPPQCCLLCQPYWDHAYSICRRVHGKAQQTRTSPDGHTMHAFSLHAHTGRRNMQQLLRDPRLRRHAGQVKCRLFARTLHLTQPLSASSAPSFSSRTVRQALAQTRSWTTTSNTACSPAHSS